MTHIWAVERGAYSDYHVVGIYTTAKNAQAVADAVGGTVAKWPLDPGADEIAAGMKSWLVHMERDGSIALCEQREASPYEIAGSVEIWRRSKAPAFRNQPNITDLLIVVTWARDEKHAVKIANEKRSQKIASGEWR